MSADSLRERRQHSHKLITIEVGLRDMEILLTLKGQRTWAQLLVKPVVEQARAKLK